MVSTRLRLFAMFMFVRISHLFLSPHRLSSFFAMPPSVALFNSITCESCVDRDTLSLTILLPFSSQLPFHQVADMRKLIATSVDYSDKNGQQERN